MKHKTGWDTDHWEYNPGCGKKAGHENCGTWDSFWKTCITSSQWKAWRTDVFKRFSKGCATNKPIKNVWDIDECEECNFISAAHFQAFLKFVRSRP